MAWYALSHVARLTAGERVLVHPACGAPGLAALRTAQHIGAEVFATAETAEERAWLVQQGIRHVWDSSTTAFRDDLLMATNHEGVDVVLSSVSGKAALASLALLAPGGRFIDNGGAERCSDVQLDRAHLERGLSYSVVALDALARRRPEKLAALRREVSDLVDRGVLSADRVAAIHSEGSYLAPGGLGDAGLSLAGWLVDHGARHLVLVDRAAAITHEQETAVAALETRGARVFVAHGDVSERSQAQRILNDLRRPDRRFGAYFTSRRFSTMPSSRTKLRNASETPWQQRRSVPCTCTSSRATSSSTSSSSTAPPPESWGRQGARMMLPRAPSSMGLLSTALAAASQRPVSPGGAARVTAHRSKTGSRSDGLSAALSRR